MQTIIKNKPFQVAILALIIIACFAGTIRNTFIWDDDDYIYQNPLLTGPGGLAKIWKSYYAPTFNPEQNTPQYYPLVFTTFYLEHKLWGFNPAGYHIVNLLLHTANAILLLLVLHKLGLNWYICLITAALFGIHPTQVESVAWATERKNVLAGLFYFSAFLSFLHYQDNSKIRYYIISLALFVCALLSKTAALGLPVALILASYLKERPIRKTIISVIPFFILSIAAGLVTSIVEHTMVGASGADWTFPLSQRILIASRTLWFYIGKILWPYPVSFLYDRWVVNTHSITAYIPLAGAILVAAAVYIFRKNLGRLTIFALIYFVVSIAPVLGFVSFYMMRYAFAADHFLYLASWSIMLLVVYGLGWAIGSLMQRNLKTITAAAIVAVILINYANQTISQVKKYKNAQTLWENTIETNPKAWLAYNNLGVIYASQQKYAKAIECYKSTIKLNPNYAIAYNNYGVALKLTGQVEKSIAYYKKSLQLNPDYMMALYNMAAAYNALEQNATAAEYFKKVVKIQPTYSGAWYNLAICLSKLQRLTEAAQAYGKVIALDPNHAEARYNLGVTYELLGKLDDAAVYYKKAIQIRPAYIEAKYRLANIYQQQGKLADAAAVLRSALETNPDYAEANFDLGMVYFKLGEYENAKLFFRIAENNGIETPQNIRRILYNQSPSKPR